MQDLPGAALAGQRTGLRFAIGQPVEARLAEASPRTGGMVFHLLQGAPAARPAAAKAAALILLLLLLLPATARAQEHFSREPVQAVLPVALGAVLERHLDLVSTGRARPLDPARARSAGASS